MAVPTPMHDARGKRDWAATAMPGSTPAINRNATIRAGAKGTVKRSARKTEATRRCR
jgi:hypothetical protein